MTDIEFPVKSDLELAQLTEHAYIVYDAQVAHHKRILAALNKHYDAYRESGNEAAEEAIADVLDEMTGWCSTHQSLVP